MEDENLDSDPDYEATDEEKWDYGDSDTEGDGEDSEE